MRGWGDLPPPHPLSACADAELPASPPPLFYNVGNGERRQEGSSAQTDAGEGVTPPPHLQIVSDVTNTTFNC